MADKLSALKRWWYGKASSSQKVEETTRKTEGLAARYKDELTEKGMDGVKKFISDDLKDWQRYPLHTGVTGNSGSGKSSFINTLRGLTALDDGAAAVGVDETTQNCAQYEHPDNKSFIVWDLPGVGTPNFPKESYLAQVGYERFDFFIVVSKTRFTENDMWLAKQITHSGKTFFFVRTNIEADVANDKRTSKNHNENTLLRSMKQNAEANLQKGGINNPKVFLIDNYAPEKYDFGKLNNELLASCEGLKKDAVALSLSAVTGEVIDEKKRVLEGRIHQVALGITTSSEKDEQRRKFQSEINFYLKQFNVDGSTLSENKEILSINDFDIKSFSLVVDGAEHGPGTTIKSPTALRAEMSTWKRFADHFTWSKEKTLLYGFCQMALQKNLDMLHSQSKQFYDKKRVKAMISGATSQ
ncbi:T-cell-specific guanine nucleotide triphosphate-binding protein 2-like [Ruditapes philippinarum]|uniref:T-cell-specific guanine nucleotide triphosphate-binding protein 2-like n=1 Tax=Ruditapes philippinarum TaxID=129788 RepID=UPI00295AA8B8|nr:T-cell-specific guanine nucleotide triphosphate-binding protein 2-like [Ruditapes philippinarum]